MEKNTALEGGVVSTGTENDSEGTKHGPVFSVSNATTTATTARVCSTCGKAFCSETFLDKHIARRHPNDAKREAKTAKGWKEQEQEQGQGTSPSGEETESIDGKGGGGGGSKETAVVTEKALLLATGRNQEDKKKGDEEVIEGARRLGELVREREHDRFRAEVDSLRKDITELKVPSVCFYTSICFMFLYWRFSPSLFHP